MSDAHLYEAEVAVIGAIVVQPDLYETSRLQPSDFYDPRHNMIYGFMDFLSSIGETIDPVSIVKFAGADAENFGGVSYLMQCTNAVPSTANFMYYHDIVLDKSLLRQQATIMRQMAQKATTANGASASIAEAMAALEELSAAGKPAQEMMRLGDVMDDHEEVINERKANAGLSGVPSCSTDLNNMIGGYPYGGLTITAARPSVGKTQFTMGNEAIAAAEWYMSQKINGAVMIFSLEMSAREIGERAIAPMSMIAAKKFRTGEMDIEDWSKWGMAKSRLKQLPIFIDDTAGITIQEIERKIKELAKKYDELYVIIDYLQLIEAGRKFNDDHKAVAYVSKSLKRIARSKDMKVAINAISAVGRKVEDRADKRPTMADLRESGSIESDADIVMFLYRDDYYNAETAKKNIVELIVAKGRNTGVGTCEVVFLKPYGKFMNLDRGQKP